jgi:hypothetical protein
MNFNPRYFGKQLISGPVLAFAAAAVTHSVTAVYQAGYRHILVDGPTTVTIRSSISISTSPAASASASSVWRSSRGLFSPLSDAAPLPEPGSASAANSSRTNSRRPVPLESSSSNRLAASWRVTCWTRCWWPSASWYWRTGAEKRSHEASSLVEKLTRLGGLSDYRQR